MQPAWGANQLPVRPFRTEKAQDHEPVSAKLPDTPTDTNSMTKHFRIKLALSRSIQTASDLIIHMISLGASPAHAYERLQRFTAATYPVLAFIYRKTRPPAHQATFRQQLLKTVLASLQRKMGGFHIDINCDVDNPLAQAIQKGQTPIILAPHLRLTTILGYYLEQQNSNLTVLSNTDPNLAFLNFGMKKPLGHIPANLSCLFKIRECLNGGTPVLVMPDYERGASDITLKKWISPSIFHLIEKYQYPVIFMWIDLNPKERIWLDFHKPVHTDASSLMDEFVRFIGHRAPWHVECKHPNS